MTTASLFSNPPPFPVRRFTVDEYHRLIKEEILTEEDAVELLAGWIVPKMPKNPPHDALIDLIDELFGPLLFPDWRSRVQSAITLPESEPEPDIAVVRGPATRYLKKHPQPGDIALLVEVSESSLARDCGEKAVIYAAANIPYYWVLDLAHQKLIVFSQPKGGVYQNRGVLEPHQMAPIIIDGKQVGELRVGDLLGIPPSP